MNGLYTARVDNNGYAWYPASSYGHPIVKPPEGAFLPLLIGSWEPPHYSQILWLAKGGDFSVREYSPLEEHPALFEEFASLTPAPEAILSFAGRYGLLGVGVDFDKSPEGERDGTGEPLERWTGEVQALRHALDVWEAWRAKDMKKIVELAAWDGSPLPPPGPPYYQSHEGETPSLRDWTLKGSEWPALRDRLHIVGPAGAAKMYLADVTGQKLGLLVRGGLGESAKSAERPFEKQYRPQNLLGCLWLQFANYLSEERDYLRCPNCRRWYEIAWRAGRRRTRRFCSDACRFEAHAKKQKARDEGQAPSQGSELAGTAKSPSGEFKG